MLICSFLFLFFFVRRDTEEGNREADKLANSALDSKINADNDEHKIKDTAAPEDYCPKCKHEVKTSGVWCIKCKNWWHFRCDRTNSEKVKEKFRDSDYVCKVHEEREEFIENMSKKNDIITKLKNEVKLFKEEKYNSQNLINTKDQEIRKLNENVVGTNRENVKLNKNISDLKMKNKDLQEKLDTISREKSELEKLISNLKQENDNIRSDLTIRSNLSKELEAKIKSLENNQDKHQEYESQIKELTREIDCLKKENCLEQSVSHVQCNQQIEELKSLISASDQQIEDLKSILKTTTTSERKAKSDLTHAIKDMNELKNEVKIQTSMAAKAELHSQVYNQLVQAKDEIIGNQKAIINQMKINCQFQELNNYENISTPIRSDTKDKQDKSHSHVQDGTISLENNQTSENKQQHLNNSNSEEPIQHLLEEKEHNQNKIANKKFVLNIKKVDVMMK